MYLNENEFTRGPGSYHSYVRYQFWPCSKTWCILWRQGGVCIHLPVVGNDEDAALLIVTLCHSKQTIFTLEHLFYI